MARGNGKPDPAELDAEHELPPAEDTRMEDTRLEEEARSASVPPQAVREGEFDKLKAERDGLLDRLARLQAEFENARKRSAREQQEFREYALADAVKELLPTLDSFERALQTSAGDKTEFRGGAEDHHVLEELQRGYKLKDRLLRPSMVKVASNPKH